MKKRTKNFGSHKRNATPWDLKSQLSPYEEYIKTNYNHDYRNRHLVLSQTNESDFLNEIKIKECRRCGSQQIVKNGKYKTGIIRYHCNTCKRNFNIFSNTLFDHHKINIYEEIRNMLDVFCGVSFSAMSKIQRNSPTTTKYWFKRLL